MGRKLGIVLGLAAVAWGGNAASADPALSPAQVALFESNHLQAIERPVVLDYTFDHRGGPGGDFSDKVAADIRAVHPDGSKDVWIDFLGGERRHELPPAKGFEANPLLMFFLEHDVQEMQAATGGAPQYFRNRLSEAFADRASLQKIELKVDGKPLAATEIEVTPFRDDPHLANFPAYAGKTYRFILSDAVPGSLYQITTTLAAAGNPSAISEERLTYAGEHEKTP